MDKSSSKTKKKKRVKSTKHLWNIFDSEIKKKTNIECIYRACGEREACDTCSHSLAFSDDGFLTCTNNKCGIIYKDVIDRSAEWRFYGNDESGSDDPTRCGMPINPLLLESSMGCKVMCSYNTSYEMQKIKRYTEWQSMPYKEKSQYNEFQRITMMAHNSGISKLIIDEAIRYHKKISEHKTFRGVNRDGIIAASIYIAFRVHNNPRTPKEIANVFMLDPTNATKGCKNAMSIVNSIEENNDKNDKTDFGKTDPNSFIERYCSKLQMPVSLIRLCSFIAQKIDQNNMIPENTPNSIAAGIVYFVCMNCKQNISKNDVNRISEISEVTINKCYKKLETMKHMLIPNIFVKHYNITVPVTPIAPI
jgi:transcription initiation factor TFIIB